MTKFQGEVRDLINRIGREGRSDTPDYILAQYLENCLSAFEIAVNKRAYWHGHVPLTGIDHELESQAPKGEL